MAEAASIETGVGQTVTSPWAMPARGWKDVALRAWQEAGQDNISLVASGVAFCAVVATVPMLGAIVLSYGLVATPATVTTHVESLTSLMPTDAARLIGEQLANVVSGSDGKKGFGLLVALGIALYGAMKGASAMITSLNIAYDENETRGFIELNLVALAITVGAVLLAILAILAITAMASLEELFPSAPGVLLAAGRIISYAVMAGAGAAAAATLYRYAPDRRKARWQWLTPGSLFASVAWLIMTLVFGFYVANFGNYDATYGSLGAAIVLLTWLYLSAYVLLLGAEFNCELERQTVRDTTTGIERPLGTRGAYAADTVASGPEADPKPGPGPQSATASLDEYRIGSEKHTDATGSAIKDYAAGRATSLALRILHAGSVSTLPSVLATGGLALLRRRGRTAIGFTFIAAAMGLCLIGRKGPVVDPTDLRPGST